MKLKYMEHVIKLLEDKGGTKIQICKEDFGVYHIRYESADGSKEILGGGDLIKLIKNIVNDLYDLEELTTDVENNDFSIGQSYTKTVCATVTCSACGSDKLIVGVDDCYTAIKCPKCEWEMCIHEG